MAVQTSLLVHATSDGDSPDFIRGSCCGRPVALAAVAGAVSQPGRNYIPAFTLVTDESDEGDTNTSGPPACVAVCRENEC